VHREIKKNLLKTSVGKLKPLDAVASHADDLQPLHIRITHCEAALSGNGRASHLQKTAWQSNLARLLAVFSYFEEAIQVKQIASTFPSRDGLMHAAQYLANAATVGGKNSTSSTSVQYRGVQC
jgi:hypothetical protein